MNNKEFRELNRIYEAVQDQLDPAEREAVEEIMEVPAKKWRVEIGATCTFIYHIWARDEEEAIRQAMMTEDEPIDIIYNNFIPEEAEEISESES